MQVRFLDREEPLEKEMSTYSSILACRIPWTEEPGGLHTIQGGRKELDTTECTKTNQSEKLCFGKGSEAAG